MGVFGRGKKHRKNGNRELSERRRRFSDREDYEDEFDEEYYGDDEEYYGDDEEYYGDDEPEEYDDDRYYEGDEPEGYDDGRYYEEDEPEEYYEEDYVREDYYEGEEPAEYRGDREYYEEEYYGDDVDYYGEDKEARYEEDGEDEDEDLYYMEGGEYEDDEDEDGFVAYRKKKGVAGAFLAFRNLPLMDKVIAFTGVAVLLFAVLTGVVFLTAKQEEKLVAAFAEVGTSLAGVDIIGESGLLAVADAQMAKEVEIEEITEETPVTPEEPEQAKGIDVSLKMTSIVKDLKIKFVNQKTDKLVANVPFEVEITTPSKKTEVWKDDDKDGVIYQENIAPGSYKVKMLPLTGFDDYRFSQESRSVDVKADIAYKKVDVKEEIKTEAEVNAALEDTAVAEVVEESKLTDTVPFVKSTQTNGTVAYKEIGKNSIKDPATVSASIRTADYYLMTAANPDASGNEQKKSLSIDSALTVKAGEGGKKINVKSTGEIGEITWKSDKPDIAAVDSGGTVTGLKAGVATVTASADGVDTVSCTVTVEEAPPEKKPVLSVKNKEVKIKVGESANIEIEKENVGTVVWSSDKTDIAEVDGSGKVTGKAKGTALVTVTGKSASGDVIANCTVTVEDAPAAATLKLDRTELSLAVGESGTIKAESNQANVIWTVAGKEFADVSQSTDGKTVTVKGTKTGKATLTATAGDQTQTCTVTVVDTGVSLDKTSVQVVVKKTADIKVTTVPGSAAISKVVSHNTNIATVAYKDKTVTVTGVAKGDTEITITCNNGREVKASVKVLNSYESDTTSLLKDKDGRQVFVLQSNGQYRQAKYADYYDKNITKFFVEVTETLYTGWQNIGGKTYYYLDNHKFVTGEQVIQGAKYNFASDGTLVTSSGAFGIDVSKWNGSIDWNSVRSSGAAYAIIRCGYRGSTTGAMIKDPKFETNIAGANAAGLKVGVYFFTQAVNEKEAVEEASMVLDLVKKYAISYPIFLDVEASGGRADAIDRGTRTAVCRAFCATIQDSGYTAGIYANKTWLNEKMDAGALGSYKIWLAQYAAAPTYNGRYNLWQYSSKGSVPGITGNVDLNLSYLGY